jgi:hypothetical protein
LAFTGALVLAATYVRFWFSVELTDESWHVGAPYELALGVRPYVDDLNVHQSQGFFTLHLVRLFLAARGSSDGLVIFLRTFEFIVLLGTGAIASRFLAKRATRAVGFGAALLVATFVPFSVPSVSYNSIGSLAFCAGALLAADASRSRRPALTLALATLAHAAAALAYPPYVLACLVSLALGARAVALERSRLETLRALGATVVAGLVPIAAVLGLLAAAGRESLARCVEYMHEVHGVHLRDSLLLIVHARRDAIPAILAALVILAGAARAPLALGRLWPLAALPMTFAAYTVNALWTQLPASHVVPTLLGVGAVLGTLRDRGRAGRATDLRDVCIASLLAAVTATLSSTNGFVNTCLGLLPAMIAGIAALARDRDAERTAASLALIAAAQVGFLFGYVYRDEPVVALSTVVGGGPWHGIRTTPGRAALVEELRADLEEQARGGARTMIAFDDMPWAYLVTPGLRPAGPTLWIQPEQPGMRLRLLLAALAAKRPLPDVVVRSWKNRGLTGDPFAAFLDAAGYRRVLGRAEYDILRRSP